MLIPPKIQIAGIEYEVIFRDNATYKAVPRTDKEVLEIDLQEEVEEDELNSMAAHIDFINCKLVISKELSDQVIDISFWHEIVHAIDFAMGYTSTGEYQNMLPIDEVSVEARSQLLLQVVKQVVEYNKE